MNHAPMPQAARMGPWERIYSGSECWSWRTYSSRVYMLSDLLKGCTVVDLYNPYVHQHVLQRV